MLVRFAKSPLLLVLRLVVAVCLGTGVSQGAEFVDDARRSVELPERVGRVFAAGAPAEILLYTLVPEMLVGRNHQPSPAALDLMPPPLRTLPAITNLPDRDDPRYDSELVALRPDVYVDYGTVDDDYVAALEAISTRTGIPGLIFDGRLANVPSVYRRLGAALGVAERGEVLAALAERILEKYASAVGATAPPDRKPPALPFNWGPRPPSVNRLLGLVWLAYVVPEREFDAAFFADVKALFEALYHVSPSTEQLRALVAP
jgi:iron complex transport system substrate-binding protein